MYTHVYKYTCMFVISALPKFLELTKIRKLKSWWLMNLRISQIVSFSLSNFDYVIDTMIFPRNFILSPNCTKPGFKNLVSKYKIFTRLNGTLWRKWQFCHVRSHIMYVYIQTNTIVLPNDAQYIFQCNNIHTVTQQVSNILVGVQQAISVLN